MGPGKEKLMKTGAMEQRHSKCKRKTQPALVKVPTRQVPLMPFQSLSASHRFGFCQSQKVKQTREARDSDHRAQPKATEWTRRGEEQNGSRGRYTRETRSHSLLKNTLPGEKLKA